jgi:hypothetical protein
MLAKVYDYDIDIDMNEGWKCSMKSCVCSQLHMIQMNFTLALFFENPSLFTVEL